MNIKFQFSSYLIFCISVFFRFRWVKQEKEFTKQAQAPDSTPKLDLGFKEGQTITLNIGVELFSKKPFMCRLLDIAHANMWNPQLTLT